MKYLRPLVIAILGIFILVMALWWLSLPSKEAAITIHPGASAREISLILRRANLISSSFVFRSLVYITGSAKDLKAGTYTMTPRASIFQVLSALTRGKANYVRVTIPEGFTAGQIADRLEGAGVCGRLAFIQAVENKKAEGFLFPETYSFELNTSPEKVIEAMTNQFKKNYTAAMQERAAQLNMKDNTAITMASIVEKEAVLDTERPKIASVFYNRLKKHWYLESCATVLYALGEHKKNLTYKDLKVDSPYNTYKYYGLPPGPICNPGLSSITAALYPDTSDAMFFVVSSSGAHSFSRYFSEHLRNKEQKKRKERNNKMHEELK